MRGLSAMAVPGGRLGRPWHILVVDHDEDRRQTLMHALTRMECTVVDASTVEEAVARLVGGDRTFDAVVIDVASSPRTTVAPPLADAAAGEGQPAALGLLGAAGSTPVVVLTEDPDPDWTEWLLAEGASAVVSHGEGAAGLLRAFAQTRPLHGHDLARLPAHSADVAGTTDLPALLRHLLETLQVHIPMGLWMFTRVDGDDWMVVDAVGDGYDIPPGTILQWPDSFCSRMVHGHGPRVVNVVADVPTYATAPIAAGLPIGCYVGMPIALEGRGLFGTLCAIDPTPAERDLTAVQWVLELLAKTLSSAVALDLERASLQRRLVQPGEEDIDALTGLASRRTWNRLLRLEEARSVRTGEHAAVIVFDVRGLGRINDTRGHAIGDQTLRRAAKAIHDSTDINDLGVRLGEGTFGVMAVGRPPADVDRLAEELLAALAQAGVDAAMGLASRGDGLTLGDASLLATDLMMREKVRDRMRAESED